MAHTYYAVHLHLVFSTKDRRPWLTPHVQKELFPYLATAIRNHDSLAHIVGGHVDHVHALLSPGSKVLVPELVKEVKRTSSLWMKEGNRSGSDFSWQEGYGVFSVSHSNLGRVRKYIDNQESHHQERTFADEFRALLVRHGIRFDERFYLG
jgi:putative transposase